MGWKADTAIATAVAAAVPLRDHSLVPAQAALEEAVDAAELAAAAAQEAAALLRQSTRLSICRTHTISHSGLHTVMQTN
jgi:hypothetical protein